VVPFATTRRTESPVGLGPVARPDRTRRRATMSFFLRAPCLQSLKQTTGIVGLEVIPNGRQVLGDLVRKVLFDVRASIPEDAGYRKVVEQTYEHRLAIIEANEDPAAIEAEIGSGQLEELVAQAKDELGLIPKMAEWKPWVFDHTIKIHDEEAPANNEAPK
jgi:NADH dehydrogenase (ubiquinone) 1 alpha subcomplex subunit 5